MRHADLAKTTRSASLIISRLVAQYSAVPSMAKTRNTLISPKPLSQTIVPSPPQSPASETACKPLRRTLICRFDFRRVKKCQPKERTNFKFSTDPYQLSRTFELWIKTPLVRRQQHFGEMVVLCFTVAVFIKHAIIYGDTSFAVSPEQCNQVDAGDDRLSFSRPVPINKGNKFPRGRAARY